MKLGLLIVSITFISSGISVSSFAQNSKPITLMDALKEAEQNSPDLKSVRFRQQASKQLVRSAKSAYLPTLDVAAVASQGAPGAPALFGVDWNIGATERVGEGAALILKQTLWDFGRTTNAVETAKLSGELEAQTVGVSQSNIDILVLRSYLDCAFLKSEAADSKFTADQAKVIAKETDRYVRSGQRSVVERYLVEQQAAEAGRINKEFLARAEVVQKRLANELGRDPNQVVVCADLNTNVLDVAQLAKGKSENPLLSLGETQSRIAESRLNQAKAEERPLLVGVVNGGYFKDSLLNEPWNYSAGVGITFPLFNGFKQDADIARFSAEAQAEEADLDFARQNVNEENIRYEEQIESTQVALSSLVEEGKLAEKAFDLAKKRYFSFQGTMVDLREALRNLDQVNLATNEAKRSLLAGQGALAFFNGARP
jgi:outer membrane protein